MEYLTNLIVTNQSFNRNYRAATNQVTTMNQWFEFSLTIRLYAIWLSGLVRLEIPFPRRLLSSTWLLDIIGIDASCNIHGLIGTTQVTRSTLQPHKARFMLVYKELEMQQRNHIEMHTNVSVLSLFIRVHIYRWPDY